MASAVRALAPSASPVIVAIDDKTRLTEALAAALGRLKALRGRERKDANAPIRTRGRKEAEPLHLTLVRRGLQRIAVWRPCECQHPSTWMQNLQPHARRRLLTTSGRNLPDLYAIRAGNQRM